MEGDRMSEEQKQNKNPQIVAVHSCRRSLRAVPGQTESWDGDLGSATFSRNLRACVKLQQLLTSVDEIIPLWAGKPDFGNAVNIRVQTNPQQSGWCSSVSAPRFLKTRHVCLRHLSAP